MKLVAPLLAFSLLGTCHDNHHDVSAQVRAGHSILVKEPPDRAMKTIDDAATIEAVAAFMAQHADSWSGERSSERCRHPTSVWKSRTRRVRC
jgi:hypothetical protein